MRSNEGGAYTRSAALTEGQVSGVFGPGAFTHCLGYTLNRGPDFIDLAKLGTFPYAFPRERGAETATGASSGRTGPTGEILNQTETETKKKY